MTVRQGWTGAQRDVVIASFLGWMLDAFDYFLVVMVIPRLATDFHSTVKDVSFALTLTLVMRPVGAFIFGRVADRFGRRPALMASVALYSLFEFASAFAPSLAVFLVLRTFYGIAMGGEWGVGASLAFESVPVSSRGWVSGVLQAGYPSGYLLAAAVNGLLFTHIGWRGMFILGAFPALLVLFIRSRIPEPQPSTTRVASAGVVSVLRTYWPLALFGIALMTAFNFFSHGSQDLYPTMLEKQRGYSVGERSLVVIIYDVGAILGGLFFGRLSNRIGRGRAIALAAALVLPIIPFWALAQQVVPVALSAFFVQFMVQGAWGVVPAHLNELSPPGVRGTFPGVVYQLGNLIAATNAPLQNWMAGRLGSEAHPNLALAMALVCAVVAVVLVVLSLAGPERRGATLEFAPRSEADQSSRT